MHTKYIRNRRSGYSSLISVLVTGAIVTAIAMSVVIIAISEGQLALSGEFNERILHRAEGCVEDVLIRLNKSNSITAGALTTAEGTCTVAIVSHTGNSWTFTVNATGNGITKRIRITAQRAASVTVNEWIEY